MSDTPQQVINLGTEPNNGTGEPLRDAFANVNNNFANIWAAGPVSTNVVITNNWVTTSVDDLDLVIAGNNLGNVTVHSTMETLGIRPQATGVYDLGSESRYYDSSFVRYMSGTSLTVTGNLTAGVVNYTGSDGSAGQVLTTYGNGRTYWSTPSGGGGGSLVIGLRSGTMSEAVTNGFLTIDTRTGSVLVPIT